MSDTLVRPSFDLDTEIEHKTEDGKCSHIVKCEPGESATAKIMEARVFGTEVEALCGHRWIPSRDPKQFPICDKCLEIYNIYRDFFGLNDRPDES